MEDEAGVKHIPLRAAHGFRRFVVGEVLARTGNLALAGQYVGDKDIRTLARSYVRERPEELRRAVEHMERFASIADRTPNDHQTTIAAPGGAATDSDLVAV